MPRPLYHGRFPELQARFMAEVTAQRASDPLTPLDVLVSGQLMRLSLRRDLARSGCSHANVRFLTLNELAHEIAAPVLRRDGWRMLHDVARGPIISRAVELAGRLQYFDRIAPREGFQRALWRTLDDLRCAGITLDRLRDVYDGIRGRAYDTLRRKLSDVVAVWRALDSLSVQQRLLDRIGLLDLVCNSDLARPAEPPAILYGFDDLRPLEYWFVSSFLAPRLTSVYSPYILSRAGDWVRPLFDLFTGLGFRPEPLSAESSGDLRSRLQTRLFREGEPRSEMLEPDESLLLISASGREREAEEVVREILYSPLADREPGCHIAVLVRDNEPYVDLLRDELRRAGVPGYFHECRTLGDSAAGRAFASLASLLDLTFRRADVMEFLLSSPVKWPASVEGGNGPLPVTEWNHFTLLAQITSGQDSWTDGLRRLRRRFETALKRSDPDDEDAFRARAGQIAALDALSLFVTHLFARLRDIQSKTTWSAKREGFWELFTEIIEAGDETETLEEEFSRASELDALRLAPDGPRFDSLVRTVLRRPVARTDRFQVNEPTVATFAQALGVPFDEVFIVGLVEKEIPRFDPQDPILSDDERRLIAKRAGRSENELVSNRQRTALREEFYFRTACQAAQRRLVLCYPRMDLARNRERLASTYLLRALEAATGQPADFTSLDRFVSSHPCGRRLPVSRLRDEQTARAATEQQFDMARLAEALRRRDSRPIHYLLASQPLFARSVLAEQHRFRQREFTAFDGVPRDPSLIEQFRQRFEQETPALSPTRLQTYATCPFRYFARYALEIEAVEESSDVLTLDPRARGSLVHEILRRFFRQEQAAGRLPLPADSTPRLEAVAQNCFREFEQGEVTGLPFLWRLERERILRWLRAFVEQEIVDQSGFIPQEFEKEFSVQPPGLPALRFRGKMDRMDIHPDGCVRVIDYKTGRPQIGLKAGSISGGRALQLPVYRLAAEALTGLRGTSATYLFLAEDPAKARVEYTLADWEQGEAEFSAAVSTIADGIRGARFYPHPEDDVCPHCDVRAACGSGRLTSKWHEDIEQTRGFRQMREGGP